MDYDTDKALEHLSERDDAPIGHSVLRPMVFSLIQSSYLHTHTLTEFVRDVVDIVGAAVTVPVAFAEGFLRSFVAIDSVEEDRSGHVRITPKFGATEEDIIREVDEIAARIEPSAIYNPVVRSQLDKVVEASGAVMRQDLEALSELNAEDFQSALAALEPAGTAEPASQTDAAAVRERLDKVRLALRKYQANPAGEQRPPIGSGTP
jgi:hypothetical protein